MPLRDYDDPNRKAVEFCRQHRLNKLAVQIVEDKIREAMQFEEHKLISHRSRSNHRSNTKVDSTHHNNRNDGNLARSPRK